MNRTPHRLLLVIRTILMTSLVLVMTTVMAEEFTFGNKTLRVPQGYTVEKVTDASLVERPIAVARDEYGRLYVTDSGGMSERAEKQLELKPHSIRRLEDTNGDGNYDRSTLFADRMMFPEGCLWHEGSLYVAAPPEIWKLTDTNDDGVADKREVWFDGKTLTGCGNDLHGPYAGFDGRLYWCKGAFAEQTYTLSNGRPFVTRSSHIFRAKSDGTDIEPVLTGGMDNPVNVAFLPNGERFLSCTFFQFPEAGFRDGLIHAIYGGVYGKKHDSIYAHPMTGDVMPVLSHQGAAAPCGLIAGSKRLFGENSSHQLYACYFNLHKVVRHQLLPTGATYGTLDEDFVTCDHPDFHPTDVFEDADGSLLVVDTGGWYKVCCPTSQLAKPDVLGAVYRVRRKDQPVDIDPLGLEIDWKKLSVQQLVDLLADKRLYVQRRATGLLRQQGESAIAALSTTATKHENDDVRLQAIWTLAGIDHPAVGDALVPALKDRAIANRQAAAHSLGLQRTKSAVSELLERIHTDAPGPARAAAEAIGRIGDAMAVPELLVATMHGNNMKNKDTGKTDVLTQAEGSFACDASGAPANAAARVREHALIYALIEIGDANSTRDGLKSSSPEIVRAALVALDQMDGGKLTADDVIPLMTSDHETLRRTAVWIVGHHADWGTPLANYFASMLANVDGVNDSTIDVLARLSSAPEIQALIAEHLTSANEVTRANALHVVAQSGLTSAPASWLDALTQLLNEAQPATAAAVIHATRNLAQPKGGHPEFTKALLSIANKTDMNRDIRIDALSTAGAGHPLSADTYAMLTSCLNADEEMAVRTNAAQLVGRSALSPEQLRMLLKLVPSAGPLELPRLLPALESQTDEAFGLQLVSALQTSEGKAGLRTDLIKPLLDKFPASVRDAGKPLLTSLNASAEQQTSELEDMLSSLPEGDINRGHEVFMGKKAACITCHKLGYGGGRLGPDLSTIGRVRTKRDLLEAIMFPGVSIVRGYEPVVIAQKDGRTQAGIIISESRDEVVLGIDATKTAHIARTDIEEILPSNVSPMPNGMIKVLTREELADVVEFLLSRK